MANKLKCYEIPNVSIALLKLTSVELAASYWHIDIHVIQNIIVS